MNYQFRPIERWPVERTPSHKRRSKWTFKAPWSNTLQLLEDELRHLRATNIVIQADVSEGDIRLDGMLRANASPMSPGVILSFESKHGPLSYPCDSCSYWQHNVRSIALALQSLRAVDRYGVTGRAEQYRGWQQLPSQSEEMSRDEAIAIRDAFDGDWRRAKIETHPDHGGSKESFKRVEEAERILSA